VPELGSTDKAPIDLGGCANGIEGLVRLANLPLCIPKRSNNALPKRLISCSIVPSLQLDSSYPLFAPKLITKSKYQILAHLQVLILENRRAFAYLVGPKVAKVSPAAR
jgi:hypothetical protein